MSSRSVEKMSYKNFLIAAAIDLDLISKRNSNNEIISYGLQLDPDEIVVDGGDNIAINDTLISRATYLEKVHEVREFRDGLLTKTDWVGLSDVTLSDQDRTTWETYRRQLRDVPSTIVEGSEDDFIFPEEPFID